MSFRSGDGDRSISVSTFRSARFRNAVFFPFATFAPCKIVADCRECEQVSADLVNPGDDRTGMSCFQMGNFMKLLANNLNTATFLQG